VTRTEDADGFYTCERCGKRKAVGSRCTSCGEGHGDRPEGSGEPQGGAPVGREGSGEPQGGAPVGRVVPEGWDPTVTSSSRPRLGIVSRPERGDGPERSE
jgi:hypothetical protein